MSIIGIAIVAVVSAIAVVPILVSIARGGFVPRERGLRRPLTPSRMVTNIRPIRRPYDQDAEEAQL